MSDKKYPIGGFAPGNYYGKCCNCGNEFQGDKRAVECEPCAIKDKEAFDALSPEEQAELIQRNAELARKFFAPPRRKPSEMTDAELAYCQDCLPGTWEYDHTDNAIFSSSNRPGKALPMKYIKLLTDYLTSINVDPYAD